MFGKLMKYNLMEVGRIMLPMYGALLVLAAALGIAMRYSVTRGAGEVITATVPGVVTLILFLVFGGMGLATSVVTVVLIVKNFRDDLLGNRGYLTGVLPATTTAQVLSRMLNAIVWVFLGGLSAALSGLILLCINLSGEDWSYALESFCDTFGEGNSPAWAILQIILLLLFWVVQLVAKLYACLATGSLFRGHGDIGAVFSFVGITALQNFLGNRLTHLTPDASIGYSVLQSVVRMIFGFGGSGRELLTGRQMAFSIGQDLVYIVIFLTAAIWVLRRKTDLQ